MARGKYDLPINVEYKSRFVDPGLDTFKEAALNYRNRFDKNQEATNTMLTALANEQFIPGEQDATQQEMQTNINNILGNVVETGAYHTADLAVNNALRYYTADPDLAVKRQNYKEYQKTQLVYDTYGANNVYDPQKNMLPNFQSVSTDAEGNKVYNRYVNKAQKVEDYNAQIQALVGNIAADKGFIAQYGVDGVPILRDILMTGTSTRVSEEKVNNIINDLLGAYKMTPAGIQHFDRYRNSDQNEFGQPLQTDKQADKAILDYMKGVTKNQIFSQTTFNQPTSKSITRSGSQTSDGQFKDFVTEVYKNNQEFVDISPSTQKELLGMQESEIFENAYTTSLDRVVVDLASANLSKNQLDAIFEGTGFEGYENKTKLIQVLDSFGFTADNQQIEYVLKDLGINDTSENRKALIAVANQITERLAAAEISNMGVGINQSFTNAVFQPSGRTKIVGGVAYPMGTMYVPKDQAGETFDVAAISDMSGPDWEDVTIGDRKLFSREVKGSDGKMYLVIDNAFGKPINLASSENQEKLTGIAYDMTDANLTESQIQRQIDRNAAIGGTLSAPQIVGPMDEVLSALQISEPTRNALSEIVTLAMKEGNRELSMMGGENLAKNFNRIVAELMRAAPDKYPTRRDAERAALVLFESSLLQ